MNSVPLLLSTPSHINLRTSDMQAEYIAAIKNADFSRQQSPTEQETLADALRYFMGDERADVARLAADMRRANSNAELAHLQELLYAQLTGSLTLLTPFQEMVCLFDHDTSIDTSLRSIGIERSYPTSHGISMLRGLCHYCSQILTGTCINDYTTLHYPQVARVDTSFVPTIDCKFNSSNATEHGQRLLSFFRSALARPAGASLPMSLIFIYQTIAYFDYMNGASMESTLSTFTNTQSQRDLQAGRIIRNMYTILSSARLDSAIDPQHILGEFVSTGAMTTTSYVPNINERGKVLTDIDDMQLILQGKTVYTDDRRSLLRQCIRKNSLAQ